MCFYLHLLLCAPAFSPEYSGLKFTHFTFTGPADRALDCPAGLSKVPHDHRKEMPWKNMIAMSPPGPSYPAAMALSD
jgi:hypothetical protein